MSSIGILFSLYIINQPRKPLTASGADVILVRSGLFQHHFGYFSTLLADVQT